MTQNEIQRHEDGSINAEHYLRQGRAPHDAEFRQTSHNNGARCVGLTLRARRLLFDPSGDLLLKQVVVSDQPTI
jgi:hypothetical protein